MTRFKSMTKNTFALSVLIPFGICARLRQKAHFFISLYSTWVLNETSKTPGLRRPLHRPRGQSASLGHLWTGQLPRQMLSR